jgi:hypothetical protein
MRRTRSQTALAVVFALLALNAWRQVAFVAAGRSDDALLLTAFRVMPGIRREPPLPPRSTDA